MQFSIQNYINRELSWLEFNQRVLDLAAAEPAPLLERAKFLAITASNLDEFFMVRVGGLRLQRSEGLASTDPTGMSVAEQLDAVLARSRQMQQDQYRLLLEALQPKWNAAGIQRVEAAQAIGRHRSALDGLFHNEVIAVLSPQVVGSPTDFPMLPGLTLHVAVRLAPPSPDQPWQLAVIPLGRRLPRLIPLPAERGFAYGLLEDLVANRVEAFFPGRQILETAVFRLTRNADIELREDSAPDLMLGMEEVLASRQAANCVRLELSGGASEALKDWLLSAVGLTSDGLVEIAGPIDLGYLFQLSGLEGFDGLRDPPWPPRATPSIDPAEPMVANIAQGDLLLVHPYERFDPVIRLIEEAARDPDVLAIKQILYRTSRQSPIVAALALAAKQGKYVTAIVELKARFDEARNIEWARELEQAGVQVIYGVKGLKTHAKICIVVRREPHGIVRYCHFGTGNYNEVTAKLYSDVSLLTCNDEFGADATNFFHAVTGASQPQRFHQIAAAPITLRKRILALIDNETQRRKQGQRAMILAKINNLVDPEIIAALYRASQAGVPIKLNVRGTCCLRPGVAGISENITVVSIVDRFLEHARVLYFHHGGEEQVYISSADWMPRNLDRRIELLVPIRQPACKQRLIEVLETYLKDNTNCWQLQANGSYVRRSPETGQKVLRAQERLYRAASDAVRTAEQASRSTFVPHQPQPDNG
jgi:polyphosphate kinase